jgi:DNA-binding NtrC family response regulator
MSTDPSILVVDDDAEMAATIADLLRQQGYTVHAATSALEAEQIASSYPRIGLALIDLVMPVMDGITLLDRLKQQRPELAVLMMSGFGTIATALEAVKLGAEDFITKPFERATIVKKIQHILELQSLREKVAARKAQSAKAFSAGSSARRPRCDALSIWPTLRPAPMCPCCWSARPAPAKNCSHE